MSYSFIIDSLLNLTEGLEREYIILIIAILALIIFAAAICLSPLLYCYYCRMMKPANLDMTTAEGKAKAKSFDFKNAFRKGWQHKGKILGVALLSLFILTIASCVLIIPGIVSTEAYLNSIEGMVNFSDDAVIPASGYILMTVAGTLSLSFVHLLAFMYHTAILYVHGDISANP